MKDSKNNDLSSAETPSGDPLGTPSTRIAPVSPKQAELAERAEELRVALPTERQRRFVLEYMLPTDGKLNAVQAALRAGYPQSTAPSYARRLMRRPDVKAAIAAAHADYAERNAYTVERCMAELEAAMEHARETANSSALVRAIELRGKLAGLLIDKIDMRAMVGSFSIVVHGLDGANG